MQIMPTTHTATSTAVTVVAATLSRTTVPGFYEKGDYLACRELTLSWKLPLEWISKAHMTNASVYVTGQNLFYITGYSGISPEAPLRWLGVDGGRYPTPRTLLLGLSVSF